MLVTVGLWLWQGTTYLQSHFLVLLSSCLSVNVLFLQVCFSYLIIYLSVSKECAFKSWRSFRRVVVFITLMLLIDARTTVAIWLSRKSFGWACLVRIILPRKREGIVSAMREYGSGHLDILNARRDSLQSSRALSTRGS